MLNIREHNENIIISCNTEKLETDDVVKMKDFLLKQPEKSIVVNLSGVSKIKSTTLGLLKKVAEQNAVSLCSLDADVFAALNLLNYDKNFSIFPDEESSIIKAPELKNRRFKVV